MSEDESMVVMASCVTALVTWMHWYWCALRVHRLISSPAVLRILLVLPIVCLAVITIILKQYASFDVRDSGTYMFFYVAMGMAWIGLFLSMPIWGVSIRDDALERRNPAAAITIVGLMLGLTFAFAGGNIGDGPGWWVVVFASGLATINLLLFWWLLNQIAAAVEHVTIDRDRASGVRSAAYLMGCGLISGRAAAGDWVSASATLVDFVEVAWLCVVLLVIAALLERITKPTPTMPHPKFLQFGVLPGIGILAAAVVNVLLLGWWQ